MKRSFLRYARACACPALVSRSKTLVEEYADLFTAEDKLVAHILDEKARKVLNEESDDGMRILVEEAASYLRSRYPLVASERRLSHTDLNPTNILCNEGGEVEGLVDWGSFGLTHRA